MSDTDSLDGKHGTSDEFYDPFCDICAEAKSRNVKPEGYCNECYQCLCKDCLMVHKRLPSTRGHVIVTGDDMPKSQADKPLRYDYCDIHPSHRKDQFCNHHKVLICPMCEPVHHKGCPVESVENACKRVPSSELDVLYDKVKDFKTTLSSALSQTDTSITKLAQEREYALKQAKDIHDKIISKVDTLFQEIKSDIESKYKSQLSSLEQGQIKLKDVIANLESSLDDINTLLGNGVDPKVFLRIQDSLNVVDKCKTDVDALNQKKMERTLTYAPDSKVKDFLSSSFRLGTVSFQECDNVVTIAIPDILFPVSPFNALPVSPVGASGGAARNQSVRKALPLTEMKAKKLTSFDVKLAGDKKDCLITGMCITNDGRRILVDCNNRKINMFSRDMKLLCSLPLQEYPLDIAVTGDREVVVTALNQKLFIVDVSDRKMKIRRTVELPFSVFGGIAVYKDRLLVTSESPSPSSVKLIDQRGRVYWSTSTDHQGQELFSIPRYVTSYDDGRPSAVIVTDKGNDTLTMLNGDNGDVVIRRQLTEKGPTGVVTDTAGNIYVCYLETGEVAVMSHDFSEEKILLTKQDGLSGYPLAIVYDAVDHQLLVSNTLMGGQKNRVTIILYSMKTLHPVTSQRRKEQ